MKLIIAGCLAGIVIGYYWTVSHYEALLVSERQRVDRIEAEYIEETQSAQVGHAARIRWLQNRQADELELISQKSDSEQRRQYRNALYISCMVAMSKPSVITGKFYSYNEAVLYCNGYAKHIWITGVYDKGEPPGVDHDYIKSSDLESG